VAAGMKKRKKEGRHTYSINLVTVLVMTRTTFMLSIEAKITVRNFQIDI
jgi:hypothetical protein